MQLAIQVTSVVARPVAAADAATRAATPNPALVAGVEELPTASEQEGPLRRQVGAPDRAGAARADQRRRRDATHRAAQPTPQQRCAALRPAVRCTRGGTADRATRAAVRAHYGRGRHGAEVCRRRLSRRGGLRCRRLWLSGCAGRSRQRLRGALGQRDAGAKQPDRSRQDKSSNPSHGRVPFVGSHGAALMRYGTSSIGARRDGESRKGGAMRV